MSIISIDAGISSIKIINTDNNCQILNKKSYGKETIMEALNSFLNDEHIDLKNVTKFVLTGIRKSQIENDIYGIKTVKIDEFEAVGLGGLFLSNLERALVISIGSGTAFIVADQNNIKHIGGTGVGGGTLFNMLKLMCNIESFDDINELISKGDLNNVDLKIKDLTTEIIKGLDMDTTAVNFGKISKNVRREDIALGIVNMVFEIIGMMAVFSTKNYECKDVVLLGNITSNQYFKTVFNKIAKKHNIRFIIPDNSQYGPAIGAIRGDN